MAHRPGPQGESGLSARLTQFTSTTVAQRAMAQLVLASFARAAHRADDEAGVVWLRDMLDTLGLREVPGVVLVRFGQDRSRVRLFLDPDREITCMWCTLGPPDFRSRHVHAALAHLVQHRRRGDLVPEWVDDRLQRRVA